VIHAWALNPVAKKQTNTAYTVLPMRMAPVRCSSFNRVVLRETSWKSHLSIRSFMGDGRMCIEVYCGAGPPLLT